MASDILPDACLGILLGLCFYRHLSTSSSIVCHCRLAWKYFALPGAGDYLPWRDSYVEYRVRRCGLGRSLMRPSTLYRSFLPSACNRTCRSDRITHYNVAWTPDLELFDKIAAPSVANSSAYAACALLPSPSSYTWRHFHIFITIAAIRQHRYPIVTLLDSVQRLRASGLGAGPRSRSAPARSSRRRLHNFRRS